MRQEIQSNLLTQPRKAHVFYFTGLLVFVVFMAVMASDMYVPSLPNIATYFHSSASAAKLTITLYLLGYSLSQLIYGPLSDAFGRRRVILIGIAIFVIGSLLSTLASSIDWLIVTRLIQGMGVGAGVCLARSAMRDIYTGQKLAQIFSYMSLVIGIGPAIAPILGGYFQHYVGWRATFEFMFVYSLLAFALIWLFLPETNKHINRYAIKPLQIFKNYKALLSSRIFVSHVICTSVSSAGIIVYYTLTPFLFQNVLKISSVEYGWLALITASGILLGKLINTFLVARYPSNRIILIGSLFMLLGSLAMLLSNLLESLSLVAIVAPMVFFMIGTGLTMANASVGALLPFRKIGGAAAAMYGCLQAMGAFIASYAASQLHAKTQLPLALLLIVLASIAFTSYFFTRGKKAEVFNRA